MPKGSRFTEIRQSSRRKELLEMAGTVANRMLLRRLDFPEGLRHAIGHEDRIVAEAFIAAGWKFQVAVHLSFKDLCFARRRRKRQRAHKLRGTLFCTV